MFTSLKQLRRSTMRPKTMELIKQVKTLRDGEKLSYGAIGKRMGISEKYAAALYLRREKTEIPDSLVESVMSEINGNTKTESSESVVVAVFSPFNNGKTINQLTLKIKIKSGTAGESRNIAILSEIQNLIRWVEI